MGQESSDDRRRREALILGSLRDFLTTYGHIARFAASGVRDEDLAQVEAEGRIVLADLLARPPTDDELKRGLALDRLPRS